MTRDRQPLDGLEEDIRDHIERETEDNIDRGMPPDEARRQAMLRFGNIALVTEDTRAVWAPPWLEHLHQDLRYAFRMLRRNPGFAATVVLTLALGIGANTAIFSVFEAIMLRTLPIQAPDELFFIAHGSGNRAGPGSNYPYFERIRARTDVFAGVTTYVRSTLKVSAGDGIENTQGQFVSGTYHAVVGVPMILGRGFASEDDRGAAGEPAAVISDRYWTRKFGRDREVLGRTLMIDGRPVPIVGVTAPNFDGLDPGTHFDITLPLAVKALDAPDFLTLHETWTDNPIVARLNPGITSGQAASAVDAVFQQYLSEPQNVWLRKIPGWDHVRASLLAASRGTAGLRDQYATSLRVLIAMVGVVLLIGCANVANLLMARGTARAKEVAVRLSIGAGRRRLIRQFLTESMLLALIGGALGFALARIAVAAIAALVGTGPNPILLDLQPNATVLTFTIAMSVLTGILFGLAPAYSCTRVDLASALKAAGAVIREPGRRWSTRQVLVAVQVGFCVLLVSGAGLLGRTLQNLQTRGSGFDRSNVLMFSLDVRGTSLRAEQLPKLCDDLLARLTSRSDVLSGSCSRNIPVNSRGNARPLEVPDRPPQPLNARLVFTNMVTPDYFRTFGIRVVSGRVFDSHDRAGTANAAVLNRAAARFFFANENPIGRTVHFFKDENNPLTIVGVVEDTIQWSLRQDPPMTVYTPLAQLREPEFMVTVALKTRQDPLALASSVGPEVRALSAHLVVDYVRTMDQQIGATLVRERLLALLSSAFGVLALVLSCIGLYGVVSYDVARRVRDLGIRLALGAQRRDVVRQVIGGALTMSSVGVLSGLLAAFVATRLLSSLLFGITARDPLTLASAAALLVVTTLLASYLPARRASSVDPIAVLRAE
jgi:predicted permease